MFPFSFVCPEHPAFKKSPLERSKDTKCARLLRRRNSQEELPKSEVRGDGREELPHAPTPEARGGGREEQPTPKARGSDERSYPEPWLQEGLEELSHIEGQEGRR